MKNLLFVGLVSFLAFAMSCSSNPCDDVVCLNDGYCANGECVCPEGFAGADCSKQQTPSKIQIDKIVITKFPATDGGAGWDLTSGADIFPQLSFDGQIIYSPDEFYQDADPGSTYAFTPGSNTFIENPNGQHSITLYDYDDFDADDFMGGINFTPYTSDNKFPSLLNLDAGGSVAFELHLSYIF